MKEQDRKLFEACALGDLEAVKHALANGANVECIFTFDFFNEKEAEAYGDYAASFSLQYIDEDSKKTITRFEHFNGYKPLHVAAARCDEKLVRLLIEKYSADPHKTLEPVYYDHNQRFNNPGAKGTNCLHLLAGLRQNQEKVVSLLSYFINLKFDVNQQDAGGNTSLHICCTHSGFNEVAELLLQNGARLDIINGEGKNPEAYTKPKNRGGIDASQRLWPTLKKYKSPQPGYSESKEKRFKEKSYNKSQNVSEHEVAELKKEVSSLKQQVELLTTLLIKHNIISQSEISNQPSSAKPPTKSADFWSGAKSGTPSLPVSTRRPSPTNFGSKSGFNK